MKRFLSYILLLLLTSCVGTKISTKDCPIDLNSKAENISGLYLNTVDSTEEYHESLITILEQRMRIKDTLTDWKNIKIEQKTSKRKLFINGYRNDSLIYTKSYRGKLKENRFSMRRKIAPIGLPPFYFFYQESKIVISSDSTGNLQINQGKMQFRILFMLTAGQNSYPCYEFKKIK